jgi:hypothetical protein
MRSGVLATLTVALLAVGPGTASARRPTCAAQSKGAPILAHTPSARIFRRGTVVYGCLNSVRRRVRLFDAVNPETGERDGRFRFARLAGRFAGFVEQRGNVDADFSDIQLYDLRGARQVVVIPLGPNSGSLTHTFVRSFNLDSGGRLAWGDEWFPDGAVSGRVDPANPPADATTFEVGAYDADGQRTLDSVLGPTPRLDVTSVRLRGATAYWLKDGAERSAALA